MIFKRLTFCLAVLITGIAWSVLLDRLLSFGPFSSGTYSRREYDVKKLCEVVKPGMDMSQVTSLLYGLGKPNSLEYRKAETQDIEFLRKTLQSRGQSAQHIVPSDAAVNVNEPGTVIYPNNVLEVGSAQGVCNVQMDLAGHKVISTTVSGGPMEE